MDIVDVKDLCRTCMKSNLIMEDLFTPIKLDDNNLLVFSDILVASTSLQVQKEDGLPQRICDSCANILKLIATFRNQAIQTEKELQKLLLVSKIKNEVSDIELKDEIDSEYFNDCEDFFIDTKDEVKETNSKKHESKIACAQCSKTFFRQTSLEKHISKRHTISNEVLNNLKVEYTPDLFTCSQCLKTFKSEKLLATHLKQHRTYEHFMCDNCNKVLSSKTLLRRHMKLHTDERPFKCSECPKTFSQLCSLKDHKRIHTGETPFLCSECGRGFNNNSNLRQHLLRHTGVKPFMCSLCPKSFCTKGQLKSHSDTHTGVHPYKCHECGASFTKLNSLKKHSMIHLGIKPFSCDTCNTRCSVCLMRFRLMRDLKRHYPIHYGTDQGKDKPVEFSETTDNKTDVKPATERRITITLNNLLDKSCLGDISIDISPEDT
ncbi:unnamed protein product [Leptidea sinapis]|uniref:Protein krueppel n=1 Tax=Leptidea sinapis TaxID=189913 RepID=A0A5E4QB62_9NEOP|nr:unnamed protein product [Leptidea sinapis]